MNPDTMLEIAADGSTILIDLPPGAGEWAVFGVSLAAAFAVIQSSAKAWVALVPWLRRWRPEWFRGEWDEKVDEIAALLLRLDPRWRKFGQQELDRVLHDPLMVAVLLDSQDPIDELEDVLTDREEE